MRRLNTRYGEVILMNLHDCKHEILLPGRFSRLVPNLEEMNQHFQTKNVYVHREEDSNTSIIPLQFTEDE